MSLPKMKLKCPLLGIYPEETKIEKDKCIPMFIAALFTIVKQPRCSLTIEQIKKMWYTHTYIMEYYSAIERTNLSQF